MSQVPAVQAPLPRTTVEWPSYFGAMGRSYDSFAFAGTALQAVADRELEVVLGALGRWSGGNVLDVGAGTARFSAPLAGRGWKVTAFDGSRDMLDVVASRVPDAQLVLGRLGEPLPFGTEQFDAVVAMRVMKYVQRTSAAIGELARVARIGARVVFDVPNGRSLARFGYRPDTIGFVTPAALREAAAANGLRILAVHDGPRLPHPVLRAAASERRARCVAVVEAGLAAALGPQHGARSLVVDAVREH